MAVDILRAGLAPLPAITLPCVADQTLDGAFVAQAEACALAGSPLYAALLAGLHRDHRDGGVTKELLDGLSERPMSDAIVLRYLAGAHALALDGRARALARHYATCGGSWDGTDAVVSDFLATVRSHRDEIVEALQHNVQTNEVGRATVLASGFATVAARHRLPIVQYELGASAGLLSNWDRYAYDTGGATFGDPASGLRFDPSWWRHPMQVEAAPVEVVERHACDAFPVDVSTAAGRSRLASFVWADQAARMARLRSALAVAAQHPVRVEQGDAGQWLTAQLAARPLPDGTVTVVFHSIVWQYLGKTSQDLVRHALATAGATATAASPLIWLRMEPEDREHANLRLTTWPSGEDETLALVGYHGFGVDWLSQRQGRSAS
jgi:hypothetical protein